MVSAKSSKCKDDNNIKNVFFSIIVQVKKKVENKLYSCKEIFTANNFLTILEKSFVHTNKCRYMSLILGKELYFCEKNEHVFSC